MKRFLALATLLAILCSFTLTSCTNPPIEPGPPQSESHPENVTQNGIKYTLSSDRSYYDVQGVSEDVSGEVIIPAVCFGLPVKSISDNAFSENQRITSVVICEGVETIGITSFFGCSLLESVKIPDSIQKVSAGAFSDCTKLGFIKIDDDSNIETVNYYVLAAEDSSDESLSLDDILCIELDAFKNTEYYNDKANWENGVLYLDKHLIAADSQELPSTYSIKNGAKSIAHEAFSNCEQLTHIDIPNSVKYIGCSAFYKTAISEITIPNGCKRIDSNALAACSNLKKIDLPESLEIIGNSLLDETPYYNNEENWERCYDSNGRPRGRVLYIDNYLIHATGGNSINYEVKEGTRALADHAFAHSGFNTVTIPSSVKRIPYWGFFGCKSLVTVNLPSSIKEFDYEAFRDCTSLKNITIPDGVKVLPEMIFRECKALSTIVIPSSVKKINECAFVDCSSLTNVTLNNGLREIAGYAFEGCLKLQSLYIPDTVEMIGDGAFSNCTKLTELRLPDGVCDVGGMIVDHLTAYFNNDSNWDGALYSGNHLIFADKRVTGTCEIREGTTDIAKYAFSHTHTLESVIIPESVEYINGLAFANVGTLESVTFKTPQNWTVYTNEGPIKIKAEELAGNCKDLLTGVYSEFVWVKD